MYSGAFLQSSKTCFAYGLQIYLQYLLSENKTQNKRRRLRMKNMFNIYYINNEKASEISILFDNQMVEKITRIKNTEYLAAGDGKINDDKTTSLPLIGKYIPNIELSGNFTYNKSNRVEDTVKVVSSKSTILKPIYEKAREVRCLDDSKIGNLIKIKDVYLSVVNSDDVIATKALMSGFIRQITIEGIGNMDFVSLVEVFFKDSAYVLCGKLPQKYGAEETIMLKIPMSAEKEMESQYSIADIEIGKVTILGIYRGKYERSDIESKLNRLMELTSRNPKSNGGQRNMNNIESDIEDGISEEEKREASRTSNTSNKVHYIDVIAIVQDINI